MDKKSAKIVRSVWEHTGVDGYVWLPTIADISSKAPRFNQGRAVKPTDKLPELRADIDSYWTPAISSSSRRKADDYGPQRVVWADCDDGFNDELLTKLRPSFLWETSPGRKQAIWLMEEPIQPSDFKRDGFVGMLTQALGADSGGVDIPQLLRLPGSWHNKQDPYKGRILSTRGTVYTRGQLLTRVAKGLGLPIGVAFELGSDRVYDRSEKMWQFARSCSEAGIPETLAFKLMSACKWNKYKNDPDKLKEDISRAYAAEPSATTKKEKPAKAEHHDEDGEGEEVEAWELQSVTDFGPIIHKPMKWVLPDIIPEAGCGLIIAAPKVGKTRVAIEIALGLASGKTPLGIDVRGQQAVGFFSLEDGEYLFAERLSSGLQYGRGAYHWDGNIRQEGRQLVWEPPKPLPLLTGFKSINLGDDADKQRLLETIEKYELKLVIIDTLSMAIGSANVSDSKEMNGILKDVREIAKATRCAIAFIHHTRKRVFEKGESIQESILGSTALHAWTEFVMSVKAPDEEEPMMRLGIQTKRGGGLKHVHPTKLKIVKVAPQKTPEE